MKVFTNNNRLHFFFRSLLLFASLLHFGSFSLTKTYKIDMYMSVARRSMGVCLCRKSRCARRRRQRCRRRRQDSSMWYRWPLSLGEQASARMIGVCAGRCDNRQTALRYRSSFFFGWLAAAHTAFSVVGSHIHFFSFFLLPVPVPGYYRGRSIVVVAHFFCAFVSYLKFFGGSCERARAREIRIYSCWAACSSRFVESLGARSS